MHRHTREVITILINIPIVEWPRYKEKGRKVRCWLGGQLLFFWLGFYFVLNLTREMTERLRSEPKLQSESVGA